MDNDSNSAFSLVPELDRGREGWEKGQQNADFIAKVVKATYQVIMVFAWVTATPGFVFMRYKFGLRFLIGFNIFGGLFYLQMAGEAFQPDGFLKGYTTATSILISFVYVILVGFQLLFSYMRHRRGEQWHSRFPGMPWPIWRFLPFTADLTNVTRFFEPAFVVGLSMILY